jgi:hypothetical protein
VLIHHFQLRRELQTINNSVLLNRALIDRQLVLPRSAHDINLLRKIKKQIRIISNNILYNKEIIGHKLVDQKLNEDTEWKLQMIRRQLKTINDNLLLTLSMFGPFPQTPHPAVQENII